MNILQCICSVTNSEIMFFILKGMAVTLTVSVLLVLTIGSILDFMEKKIK